MNNLANLNLNNVETTESNLLPVGTYIVDISESNLKDNKAGNGQYVETVLIVLEGNFKGRKIWHRMNVKHPNPTAVEIGLEHLASLSRAALGTKNINDTSEMLNKVIQIDIEHKTNKRSGKQEEAVKNPRKYKGNQNQGTGNIAGFQQQATNQQAPAINDFDDDIPF